MVRRQLALQLVAQTVQELFGGAIGEFLRQETPIFDDIRAVLDQQFAHLSPLEQEILFWLAIEREPISAATLRNNLVQQETPRTFLEALRALQHRSLLETVGDGFTLQNVLIEYMTERLVAGVCAADGLVESIHTQLLPFDHEQRGSALDRVGAQLDPATFAALWAEGRATTLDQAIGAVRAWTR